MRKFRLTIKLLVTIIIFYFIFRVIDFDRFIAVLSNVSVAFLMIAVLLAPVYLFFRSLKWYFIARFADQDIKFGTAFFSYLVALGFGVVLPSKIGEFTRAYYVSSKNRLKLIACVFIDEILNLIIAGSMALAGVFLFLPRMYSVFLIILLIIMFYFLYNPRLVFFVAEKFSTILPWKDKIKKSIWEIKEAYNQRVITISLILSLISFTVIYFQGYMLILALGGDISFRALILVFPILSLVKVVPITIGGLGVREGVTILLLTQFGIVKEIALSHSLLWFALAVFLPGMVGLLLIPFKRTT